jgi:hypothetical protein
VIIVVTGGVFLPNLPNLEVRKAIFSKLVQDGMCPASVAKALHLKDATVFYHVRVLEAQGAIERIGGRRNPSMYRRGPNYGVYEPRLEISSPQANRPLTVQPDLEVSSPPDPPLSKLVRVERAWFTVKINKFDPGHVWWERESKLGPTTRHFRRFVLSNGRLASFEAYNNVSAMIKIEPFQIDSSDVARSQEIATTFALQVIHLASHACKMSLGLPEPSDSLTYANPLPALQGRKLGHIPVTDTSWMDDSPRGRPEWETKDLEEQIAYSQMPKRILDLEKAHEIDQKDHEVMKHALGDIIFTLSKLLSIFEKLTQKDEDKPLKPLDDQDKGAYR